MEGQKPEVKSDDVDLGQLFTRIGDSFRSAWLGFMRFLATLRRTPMENKLSFMLIITASLVIGILVSFVVRKHYYESRMIFGSDYLNRKLAESIIDKLDILAREKSKRGLAVTLGLPDSSARKIIGFEIKPFMAETDVVELEILKQQIKTSAPAASQDAIDEVIERIEIENRHAYEITVRTTSPSVVARLQEAIVGYLQRIPYIEKRVSVNERNLLDLKSKLSKDIERMDSLKAAIYDSYRQMASQSKGSNNVIFGDKAVSNPVDVFNKSLDIYELYEEVNADLYTKKDFEVIDGFTEFSEPANASIITIILESLLIGIVVAYLDVALRIFNKYLANLK